MISRPRRRGPPRSVPRPGPPSPGLPTLRRMATRVGPSGSSRSRRPWISMPGLCLLATLCPGPRDTPTLSPPPTLLTRPESRSRSEKGEGFDINYAHLEERSFSIRPCNLSQVAGCIFHKRLQKPLNTSLVSMN